MTAIIDYGVGNLFSLKCSFGAVGAGAEVTGDPEKIRAADRIILPGVGAFGDAAEKLSERGLDKLVIEEAERGKPLLGICLGMQLLFDKSFEYGEHPGLGQGVFDAASDAPVPEKQGGLSGVTPTAPITSFPHTRNTGRGSPPRSRAGTSSAVSSTPRRAGTWGSIS